MLSEKNDTRNPRRVRPSLLHHQKGDELVPRSILGFRADVENGAVRQFLQWSEMHQLVRIPNLHQAIGNQGADIKDGQQESTRRHGSDAPPTQFRCSARDQYPSTPAARSWNVSTSRFMAGGK